MQTAVPQSFYPLQVGNRWDYAYVAYDFFGQVTRDTFTVSVVGIANLPNGMTYFELEGPEISWFTYVRIDSGRVHYFSMLDTADVMMYDLHAELNDSWPSESRYFFIYRADISRHTGGLRVPDCEIGICARRLDPFNRLVVGEIRSSRILLSRGTSGNWLCEQDTDGLRYL